MNHSLPNNDDANTPRRLIVSLFSQPYKSILHSHFRLLGPTIAAVGCRTEYERWLEKEVARRVFDLLRRGKDDDGRSGNVKFVRLVRFGKGDEEEVHDAWALKSELFDYCVLLAHGTALLSLLMLSISHY
jgi:hypothetical protein